MSGSTQDPIATRAIGAAVGLVMLPACLFGLASLYLLIGGRLEVISACVVLAVSGLTALALARRTGGGWISPLIVVAVVAVAAFASHFLIDTSWDGQRYHYDATRALADGWNPYREAFQTPAAFRGYVWSEVWPQYYPYAAWLASAVQVAAGIDIETAKLPAFLLAAALFLAAFGASASWGLNRWQALALAVCTAGNPVVVVQLFSRMNDGMLGACFGLCAIFAALWLRDRRLEYMVVALAAMAFGLNLKFSALPAFGVLCALIVVLAWLALGRAQAIRTSVSLFAGGVFAVCLLGAHPYVTNTLEHHHPFYPVFGANAIDIMTPNRPGGLRNVSEIERLARSYFGPTSNRLDTGGNEFKIPFTIRSDEFGQSGDPGTRLAAFGPLFSGALLFALALALWIALRDRTRTRAIALCAIAALAVASLSMPEAWWARYVPQLWWTLVLVAVVAWTSARLGVRLAGWALVALLSANMAFVAAAAAQAVSRVSDQVRQQIEQIVALHEPVCVHTGQSNARLELLRNAGVEVHVEQSIPAGQTWTALYSAGLPDDPSYAPCGGTSGPPSNFALTLNASNQVLLPEGSPIRVSAADGGLLLQGYVANASTQLKTGGASVALGGIYERGFAGHRVRVTFRAMGVGGAAVFTAAYSTHGNGNSGWRVLRVTDTPSDVSFDYDVPTGVMQGNDFVGVVPPQIGGVEIQSITVSLPQ